MKLIYRKQNKKDNHKILIFTLHIVLLTYQKFTRVKKIHKSKTKTANNFLKIIKYAETSKKILGQNIITIWFKENKR